MGYDSRVHDLRVDHMATMGVGREGWIGAHQVCVSPQYNPTQTVRMFTHVSVTHRYENGINTFDTANMYSNGESERILGKALKEYNIPREKVVIMTKVCTLEKQHTFTVCSCSTT